MLHVTSKTESFSSFLKETNMPVYQSHEKGDIISRRGKKYDDYGFSCAVSDREWNDVSGQIEDARDFLVQHRSALRNLIATHCVTDVRFDFPYMCRLDEQFFMQSGYLPPDFMKLAGELGIGVELSLYRMTGDENSEQDAAPDRQETAPASR